MRRVAVVVGLLLSFVALLAPWVSLGLGAGLEISLNGLGTLNLNGVTSDGMGEWAVRVRLTVLLMVVYLAMAVIAMMADHLRSRTYEIVLTVLAAVLVLFMIWGVINSTGNNGNSRAGVWFFLVFVLLTAAAQVWQLVLTLRATSGIAGYRQPGVPAGPPQGPWGQPPAQQPWNPAPGPNGPHPGN